MTVRLFNKIAASLNYRPYLPPEPPAGPGHHVPVQDGEILLHSGNEGYLFSISMSIGSCFKVALGLIVQ